MSEGWIVDDGEPEGGVVYRVSDRGSLSSCQDRANIATISSEPGHSDYIYANTVRTRVYVRVLRDAGE